MIGFFVIIILLGCNWNLLFWIFEYLLFVIVFGEFIGDMIMNNISKIIVCLI